MAMELETKVNLRVQLLPKPAMITNRSQARGVEASQTMIEPVEMLKP
jgi:hypothetical protein